MNARHGRWSLRVLFVGLAGMSMSTTTTTTARASDDEMAVGRSARLLEEISSDPKPGIPQDELRQAVGILIVPRIVEIRVGLGRKSGHGVFLSRDEKGEWGHPEPFDISGLGVGAEASHMVTDLVVLFQTRKAVEEFGKNPGRFTIHIRAGVGMHEGFHHHPTGSEKDYHVYARHQGFWVGTGMSAERMKSPAFKKDPKPDPKPATMTASNATKDSKATAAAAPATATAKTATKPAERQPDPRTVRHTRADEARIRRLAAAPSMPRLKAMLTAMTAPPAQAQAQAAATGTRDAAVRPAAGSRTAGVGPAPTPAVPPR